VTSPGLPVKGKKGWILKNKLKNAIFVE